MKGATVHIPEPDDPASTLPLVIHHEGTTRIQFSVIITVEPNDGYTYRAGFLESEPDERGSHTGQSVSVDALTDRIRDVLVDVCGGEDDLWHVTDVEAETQ